MSRKFYILFITVVILIGCSNNKKNSEYAAIHKIWKFKKDSLIKSDSAVGLFYGRSDKITYLNLTDTTDLTFSFEKGRFLTTSYQIVDNIIIAGNKEFKTKYKIQEFNKDKLGLVELDDFENSNNFLVEMIFEPKD